jgi:drug/metabolite transporter (DMT)-like permease
MVAAWRSARQGIVGIIGQTSRNTCATVPSAANTVAMGMAVLSALLMASSGPIAKFSGLDASLLTLARLSIGALCVLLWLWLRGRLNTLGRPDRYAFYNALLLCGFMLGFLYALVQLSLAQAIMLVYLAPVAAAVFAVLLYKERLTLIQFACMVAALFGTWLLLPDIQSDTELSFPTQGLCYALLALVSYTTYLLLNRNVKSKLPLHSRNFWQLALGGSGMLLLMCGQHVLDSSADQGAVVAFPWQHLGWKDIGFLLLAGLLPGFLAMLCALYALQHLSTRLYGSLAYVEPAAVVLMGWIWFGEQLSLWQSLGVLLILFSGIVQTQLKASTRP